MTVAEQIQAEERLGKRLEKYAGKWVAVGDHKIVASADSLDELLARIDNGEQEVAVFEVPVAQDATYVL